MVNKTETVFGGTLALFGLGIVAFNNFIQAFQFIKQDTIYMVFITGFIIGSIILFMLGVFD